MRFRFVLLIAASCTWGTYDPSNPSDASSGDATPSDAADAAEAGPVPTLIPNQAGPTYLAVGSTYMYWTNNNGNEQLMACALGSNCAGKNPTQFAMGQQVLGIAVSTTGLVYWVDLMSILSCPFAGSCTPNKIATAQFGPEQVAVDDINVYWTNKYSAGGLGNKGAVFSCPLNTTGCAPTQLDDGKVFAPAALAVGGNNVYWGNAGGGPSGAQLEGCSRSGCGGTPTTYAGSGVAPNGVQGIAVDTNNIYFTINNGQNALVVPLAGGSANTFGTTSCCTNQQPNFTPVGIASDGTNVYWASFGTQEIVWCPTTGCKGAPAHLVNLSAGATGVSIVLDSANVYWTDRTGGIVGRIAKP